MSLITGQPFTPQQSVFVQPGARRKGERVRWYLIGMGTEADIHTPHWHGETGTMHGEMLDVVQLMPGAVKTVDLETDNPGTWLFHCHVNDHVVAGMITTFTVMPRNDRP